MSSFSALFKVIIISTVISISFSAPCPEFTEIFGPSGITVNVENHVWEDVDDSTKLAKN